MFWLQYPAHRVQRSVLFSNFPNRCNRLEMKTIRFISADWFGLSVKSRKFVPYFKPRKKYVKWQLIEHLL